MSKVIIINLLLGINDAEHSYVNNDGERSYTCGQC